MRFKKIIVLIILFNISCTKNKTYQFDDEYNEPNPLLNVNSFTLELDSVSSYEFFSHSIVDNGIEEELYVLNKQLKSIDVFNINSGSLIKRFFVETEGPFGIPTPYAFLYAGKDSIFIFNQNTFKNTQMLNSSGKLETSFTPTNMMDYRYGLNHYSLPTIASYYLQGKIYFGITPFFETSDASNINKDMKFSGVFDLNKLALEEPVGLRFPNCYLNKGWSTYHAFFSWVKNNNDQWIVSWNASDSLFTYDLDFNEIKAVVAKSKFVNSIEPLEKLSDAEEHLRHGIMSGVYRRIIFDQYRNCYYRIVVHPRELEIKNDQDSRAFEKSPFSIIKLNQDLELVSETKFQGGVYSVYTAFVTKQGLCLPKTNYWNDVINEDLIQIDVFR